MDVDALSPPLWTRSASGASSASRSSATGSWSSRWRWSSAGAGAAGATASRTSLARAGAASGCGRARSAPTCVRDGGWSSGPRSMSLLSPSARRSSCLVCSEPGLAAARGPRRLTTTPATGTMTTARSRRRTGVRRPEEPAVPTTDLGPAATNVARVLAGITDEQLTAPTPCPRYTVGDLLDHVGGLSVAFMAAATKTPMAAAGPDTAAGRRRPPRPGLAGDDPGRPRRAGRRLARGRRLGRHDRRRPDRDARRDRRAGGARGAGRARLGSGPRHRPALRRRRRHARSSSAASSPTSPPPTTW